MLNKIYRGIKLEYGRRWQVCFISLLELLKKPLSFQLSVTQPDWSLCAAYVSVWGSLSSTVRTEQDVSTFSKITRQTVQITCFSEWKFLPWREIESFCQGLADHSLLQCTRTTCRLTQTQQSLPLLWEQNVLANACNELQLSARSVSAQTFPCAVGSRVGKSHYATQVTDAWKSFQVDY